MITQNKRLGFSCCGGNITHPIHRYAGEQRSGLEGIRLSCNGYPPVWNRPGL